MSTDARDISSIFPEVLKQVFVPDVNVKRLTHICLSTSADKYPELALLCVNGLQKDLSDNDPIVRSLAVRTICTIRAREVSEHALLTLQKASLDSSVYVREVAAGCLPTFHDDAEDLYPLIERLISDSEPIVLSAALVSVSELMRKNRVDRTRVLQTIHTHFTRLVDTIPQLPSWGQYAGMAILYEYSILNFSAHSSSEDLKFFLNQTKDIVRYTQEGFVAQIGLSVLLDLGGPDILPPNEIEDLLFNHCQKLPRESKSGFLKPFSDQIKKRSDLFFVSLATDSLDVVLCKLEILHGSISVKNFNSILTETHRYIDFYEKMGISDNDEADAVLTDIIDSCIRIIVSIGSAFPETAPKSVYILCAELTSEKVSGVCEILSKISKQSLEFENLITSTCGVLVHAVEKMFPHNEESVLPVLTLLTTCHDLAPLIAPNLIRLVASHDLENQDPYVKLQLVVLVKHALEYHKRNSTSSDTAVSPSVSAVLIQPLSELSRYITHVAKRDPIVGEQVACVNKLQELVKYSVKQRSSHDAKQETKCMYSKVTRVDNLPPRPVNDTCASLRAKRTAKSAGVKSFSSDQATANSMYQ